jgi:hypothetical protein
MVTDPPGTPIDIQDVQVEIISSDESTVVGEVNATDPTLIDFRILAAGSTGPATLKAKVDADQDLGEVRLLDGEFAFDVVDSVTEPTAVALVLEGPIVDDVP